jgi:hypothetical protein
MSAVSAMPRLLAACDAIGPNPAGWTLADLFAPLDRLLVSGGDPRVRTDPASRLNVYGCRPSPCPDMLSFASCTATSISRRAYRRAGEAREALMQAAIADGLEAAFDARQEAMRDELKAHLAISPGDAEVVFSPSGTDAQLQALFLARALLGPALTTLIVAADQTGSGTADTARGRHFSDTTANGAAVAKGEPIEGLADGIDSVALPWRDDHAGLCSIAKTDARVLRAVETSIANGRGVLLQIMDSSKFGWRAPSDQCLDELAQRFPGRVQLVVDACQMRLGRPRLRKYLERGYIVLITGSKFFTGPAFSGALLVPRSLAPSIDAISAAAGLFDYTSRSDWPMRWAGLRGRFPVRANFGQWLRWEAALAEIRDYYAVPEEFRRMALLTFGKAVQRLIAASPSLRPLSLRQGLRQASAEDDELALPSIFPFLISRADRVFSPGECRALYRALARNVGIAGPARGAEVRELAARTCLIGQPVGLGEVNRQPAAALRICAGARLATEAWSPDPDAARSNLRREIDSVGTVVAKIEWLVNEGNAIDAVGSVHEA